jgi:hypothetical protein
MTLSDRCLPEGSGTDNRRTHLAGGGYNFCCRYRIKSIYWISVGLFEVAMLSASVEMP